MKSKNSKNIKRRTDATNGAGVSKVYDHVGQFIEGVGNGQSSTVVESITAVKCAAKPP
jgi:hypothetical protein